jgi:hypothetical protein
MDVAYQVIWRRRDGVETPTRLRLEPHGLRLEPLEGGESHEVLFEEVVGVELDPSEEGGGGLELVLASGDHVGLSSNVKRWILSDLVGALFVDRLGAHGEHRRALVRVRLAPGCGEQARRLLLAGPPFDPASTALVLHEVFVSDDEAFFLFETDGDSALLSLARPDFWRSAGAWSKLIAGSVKVVEPAYRWEREQRAVLAEAHPGLGL